MKTPMQELIDLMIYKRKLLIDVNTNFSRPSKYSAVRIEMLTYTIEWAESMLEKEKEQIINAHLIGQENEIDYWNIGDKAMTRHRGNSMEYYEQTYGGNK